MADATLIQGAISGMKTAGNIAQSFLELKSLSEVQNRVIDLQSAIMSAQSSALSAQSEQSDMINRIRTLEKEMADIETWEQEKKRYILHKPEYVQGFVYAVKKFVEIPEPAHYICTTCCENGKKSILQPQDIPAAPSEDGRHVNLVCHVCDLVIKTAYEDSDRFMNNIEYAKH